MNGEQLTTQENSPSLDAPQKTNSPFHLAFERIGIALIAIISLLIPLIIGLLFYLAVTDGLVINDGDPLHEVRLWMVQERKGATGLGLTITSPRSSSASDTVCAHTSVTFLRWDRSLRIENEDGYCRCYANRNGQFTDASSATCR